MNRRLLQSNGGLFALYFALNFLFVYPHFFSFGFVNEDTALLAGSLDTIRTGGAWHLFVSSYGPRVIRPWQLIGMFFEGRAFGFNPLPFQFVTLLLVAFGQTVVHRLLLPFAGTAGALLGASLFAFALGASEPRYWLSDRHDLYFLLFFAGCLASARALLRVDRCGWKRDVGLVLLLSILYWGDFYSNEKATAAPAVVCALASAFCIATYDPSSKRTLLRKWGILVTVSLLNTAGYFLLRRWVLGEFIGGYNQSVLPPGGLTIELFWTWMLNVLSVPFRQATDDGSILCAAAIAPAIVLAIGSAVRGREGGAVRVSLVMICALGALFLSAVPTFQYSISAPASGNLNSRMQWFPCIVSSILLGTMFGAVLRRESSGMLKGAVMYGFGILLLATVSGGREGGKNFAKAAEYTREVVRGYAEYCACLSAEPGQVMGLHPFPYGVNSFSEGEWLLDQTRRAGTPMCEGHVAKAERDCKILVQLNQNRIEVAPIRISQSKQSLLWKEIDQHSKLLLANNFNTLRFKVDAFPSGAALFGDAPILISGWASERKVSQPVEIVALLADEKVLVASAPNVKRSARSDPLAPTGERRFGFALALDPTAIPKDTKFLRLVALGKAEALGGAWAGKTLAQTDLRMSEQSEDLLPRTVN